MLVYKACQSSIVTLKLLPDSITNESRDDVLDPNFAKFRTNKAQVISIENLFTGAPMDCDCSLAVNSFKYQIGTVVQSVFDHRLNLICTSGIHYFKTREAAKSYGLSAYGSSIVEYHDNGAKRREGKWKDGKYLGNFKRWYYNGNLAVQCFFNDDGNLDGAYEEFYQNGMIRVRIIYENGEWNGAQETYSYTGELVEKCIWKHDKCEFLESEKKGYVKRTDFE